MTLGVFDSTAQFLEVLGTWLAAIATFTVAYIALRVANRANAQYVKVDARPRILVHRGARNSNVNIFSVSATNLGIRPVTIRAVTIKSRWPRYNAILLEGLLGSSPLPVTLDDGGTASWQYPEKLTDGKNWYRDFAEHFGKYNRFVCWLLIRNLRFSVVTSLGNEFVAPPSSGLREKVHQQILEIGERK